MPFTTPIHIALPLYENDLWITLSPLNFQSTRFFYSPSSNFDSYFNPTKPKNYVVPAGYGTDLSSVPRLPIVFWLVGSRGAAAGVVHDWLYEFGLEFQQIANRQEADDIYLEILEASKVNHHLANLMYRGVQAFGEGRFNGTR